MRPYVLLPVLVIALPQAVASSAQGQPAGQLAGLMVPADVVLEALIKRHEAEYLIGWNSGDGKALEGLHPGLTAHTMQAAVAAYRSVLDRRLPELMQELSADLEIQLTPEQITAATRFLQSSTGRKVIDAVSGSLRPGRTADELRDTAAARISKFIDESDESALQAFLATGAAPKFTTLRAAFRPKIAAWAARANVEAELVISAEVERATIAFLDASGLTP